jgi:hypothetical protein
MIEDAEDAMETSSSFSDLYDMEMLVAGLAAGFLGGGENRFLIC